MLKATFKDRRDGDRVVLLGLSRLNCERLLEGKPITVKLRDLGVPFPIEVVLMGGETELAMSAELQRSGVVFTSDSKIHIDPKTYE